MANIRALYERYFPLKGLRVITAADGQDALQMIEADRPDAIVLDLVMPRMSGWDVLKGLKSSPAPRLIPIVAMGGRTVRDQAIQAGANTYVQKPGVPEGPLREVVRVLSEPLRRADAH